MCVYVCVCALLGNLGHLWARLEARTRVAVSYHICSSVVLGLDDHPNGLAMMVSTVSTTPAPVPQVMVVVGVPFVPAR